SWFRKSADQGNAFAQQALGVIYEEGIGVPQHYAEAMRWYRKAAEQGEPLAQYSLAIMYSYRGGVRRDYIQAHKWFNLAAARSTSPSPVRENAIRNRDLVARKMTPAQMAEAKRLAQDWVLK
ncbi:MAG: tetratricopeptide repeat protein, partial [Betaproteobacteria bacterium]